MALHRDHVPDPSAPLEQPAAGLREERRSIRSTRVALGSLACPHCDAPVAPAGPAGLASVLACPWCDHRSVLRDFLSLSEPLRPAVVAVHVRLAARGG